MSANRRNVRFWVYWFGWVKLTLRPGQSVTIESGGPTDEGYSHTVTVYSYDPADNESPGVVTCDVSTNSQDCDGRHNYDCSTFCPVDDLRARNMAEAYEGAEKENAGIFAPDWQRGRRSQRDYFAEAAGY